MIGIVAAMDAEILEFFENAKKEHDNAAKEIEDLKKSLEGKEKDSPEYKDIEKQIKEYKDSIGEDYFEIFLKKFYPFDNLPRTPN